MEHLHLTVFFKLFHCTLIPSSQRLCCLVTCLWDICLRAVSSTLMAVQVYIHLHKTTPAWEIHLDWDYHIFY